MLQNPVISGFCSSLRKLYVIEFAKDVSDSPLLWSCSGMVLAACPYMFTKPQNLAKIDTSMALAASHYWLTGLFSASLRARDLDNVAVGAIKPVREITRFSMPYAINAFRLHLTVV